MTAGFEVKRTNTTSFNVDSIRCMDQPDVSVFIKFGKDLEEAVEAGMPKNTKVNFHKVGEFYKNFTLKATHVETQEIP